MAPVDDHFGGHAAAYRAHRPLYPADLYKWLMTNTIGHDIAWDAGTGNGQVAVALAAHYAAVHATDSSARQIAEAELHPCVRYGVQAADALPPSVAPGSVDLVTVAQALHWFDRPAFYATATQALRPGGLLAVWCYRTLTVDAAFDALIEPWYRDVIGPYWPPGREMIDDGYAGVRLPGEPLVTPAIRMAVRWDLAATLAYLRTWSAVRRYLADTGHDPVAPLEPALAAAWGDPALPRDVTWPLVLLASRMPSQSLEDVQS